MVALATEFADKMAEMGCNGIFLATTAQVDSYTGERKKIIGALKK